MKSKLVILLASLVFASCSTNPTAHLKTLIFPKDTKNLSVILPRALFPVDTLPFIIHANNKEIPYQIDDLDGDGKWDEAFLITDFKAGEKINFSYIPVKRKPIYPNRVAVTFAEKKSPNNSAAAAYRLKSTDRLKAADLFQMEGPAWENDQVGFRNYYDQRNVIDIFGKQVNDLSLAKAGINGQNYHELDTWGMDILKVGTSLGAGGIAIAKNDTIYRIADTRESHFKLKMNGPLRAVFSLVHNDFKIGSNKYQINHEITIYAGTNFYESAVTITGLTGKEKLVTGIVNLHSDSLHLLQNEKDNTFIIATHDKQAENGAMLGMAISTLKSNFHSHVKLPTEGTDLTNSYALFLHLRQNKTVKFKFTAAWENQDKKMADKDYFLNSLTQ